MATVTSTSVISDLLEDLFPNMTKFGTAIRKDQYAANLDVKRPPYPESFRISWVAISTFWH